MQWLTSFLRSDTPESAGRFALIHTIFNWTPIGFMVAWYIWYRTYYYKDGPDWEGLSLFVGSMAAFYAALLGMKAVNKAQENKSPTKTEGGNNESNP